MKSAMKPIVFAAAGALAVMGSFAIAQDSTTPQGSSTSQGSSSSSGSNAGGTADASSSKSALSSQDKMFMMQANESNYVEIKTSQLAEQKDPDNKAKLKDFAEHMIGDHTTAEDDLKQLASQKNVTLPSDVAEPKHKAAYTKLTTLSGAAFNSSYEKLQHQGHVQTVAAFKKEISNGKDADVKAYAQKYLPKIEEHTRLIQALMSNKSTGSMKMHKSSGSSSSSM